MRTRNRTLNESSEVGSLRVESIPTDPNYPIQTNYPVRSWQSLVETMTDQQPKMKSSGSVLHTKVERRYLNCDLEYVWNSNPTNPSWPYFRRIFKKAGLFNAYVWNQGWGEPNISVPSTWDWKTLSFNAVEAMRPSLNEEGLLMPNYIGELPELAHMFGRRGRTNADSLPNGLASVTRRTARRAAQLNLLYQFAVRPLISDTATLWKRIKTLQQKVDAFIKEAETIQTRHYKCPLPDRIVLPNDIIRQNLTQDINHPGHRTTEVTRWQMRPTYHATMRYQLDASIIKSRFGKLWTWLNAFGVDRGLSSLWEAIPYSFVVDWFFNVGDMLKSLEDYLTGTPLPIRIVDFNHSIKYHYVTRLNHQQGNPKVILSDIILFEKSVKYYERRSEAPCLWDSLAVRSPSLNQVGLGASLIAQKVL